MGHKLLNFSSRSRGIQNIYPTTYALKLKQKNLNLTQHWEDNAMISKMNKRWYIYSFFSKKRKVANPYD